MNEPYQPISCALLEQLELAALRGHEVALLLGDASRVTGRVRDVQTRDGADYVLLECASGMRTLRADEVLGVSQHDRREP